MDLHSGYPFGRSRDGLPYTGRYRSRRIHYAMGYGGNGITFSVIAARLIGDAIRGKKNPDAALFAFERFSSASPS